MTKMMTIDWMTPRACLSGWSKQTGLSKRRKRNSVTAKKKKVSKRKRRRRR